MRTVAVGQLAKRNAKDFPQGSTHPRHADNQMSTQVDDHVMKADSGIG